MPPREPPAPVRRPLLDPRNDLVFKLLLTGPGSEPVLRYVLEAVLRPRSPIRAMKILDPAIRPEELGDKPIVLDVRVALDDGAEVDVEMQSHRTPHFADRIVYYGARALAAQLVRGAGYGELRPVVVIAFLAYRELDTERFHSDFELRDRESGLVFSSLQRVHVVELPKIIGLDEGDARGQDPLVVFCRFLMARREEELVELAKGGPAMKQAIETLTRLSDDETVRRLAADREARRKLDEWFRQKDLDEAKREAQELGLAEGRAEGRVEALSAAIATMRAAAMPDDRIAALLGLDAAELASIAATKGKRTKKARR